MRLTTRTSLVVVILCLDSHEKLSIAIEQQIQAILGVFEVNVATCCHQIGPGVSAEDEEALLAQLIEGAHFHLAVVFVTESNPGGGWFTKSGKASVQVGEANFLGWMNNQVRGLSARALSVRYFGICCGWNLQGEGVMSEIEAALRLTGVLSFVVPTVCSALPSDFAFMLSEIFISLYYFGADLLPTLYKVWGRSEEARYHTGLLNVERKKKEEPFSVTRLFYAPRDRRPLGVDLPVASTICGCRSDTPEHRTWDYVRDRHNEGGELVFICESVCCKTLLYVAIFHRRRRSVKRHDLVFVEEDWESSTHKFLFNDSTMVRMKVFVSDVSLPSHV
ncbi:hypothetical protein FRC09_000706 [Ceratobasidium sp. 395]|nr:hypothetical protein FRC09_000706 [Ceratobasidium sp. 395]